MLIIKSGDPNKNTGSFRFSCDNCGCEWAAERKEVSFTPPCLPYEVYMKCPNCKRSVTAMGHKRKTKRQEREAWEYGYRRMKDSGLC